MEEGKTGREGSGEEREEEVIDGRKGEDEGGGVEGGGRGEGRELSGKEVEEVVEERTVKGEKGVVLVTFLRERRGRGGEEGEKANNEK